LLNDCGRFQLPEIHPQLSKACSNPEKRKRDSCGLYPFKFKLDLPPFTTHSGTNKYDTSKDFNWHGPHHGQLAS